MKRGFGLSGGVLAVAMLCSILFATPAGAESYLCLERKANVLAVTHPGWKSRVVVTSPSGATVETANCKNRLDLATIPAGGAFLGDDIATSFCNKVTTGVYQLEVNEGGCASYETRATYEDPSGALNVITIPELPSAIARGDAHNFLAIQNGNEPPYTWFALIPATPGFTRIALKVYDGQRNEIGTEIVDVSGFTFYQLKTSVAIGSVEARNIGAGVGPADDVDVYVVGFTGFERGSPRVAMPSLP